MEIELSSSKIRKILISGGCWTTEWSREIAELASISSCFCKKQYRPGIERVYPLCVSLTQKTIKPASG